MAASIAAHGGVLAFLLWPRPEPPQEAEPLPPPVISIAQAPLETPAPVPAPTPSPAKQPPKAQTVAKTTPTPRPIHTASHRPTPARAAPSHVPTEDAEAESDGPPVELSDAELAGAASADAGAAGGGACDMARRVQAALRKDPLVRAALTQAPAGRPILVWKGDWVQSHGEDGKGLSAVREAIAWEVGFSPAACRAQPVHGFILFSLSGSTRLAVGSPVWRWSDLLK